MHKTSSQVRGLRKGAIKGSQRVARAQQSCTRTKFKLRNKDDSIFNIFTGGVVDNGESHATFESTVEDKISLTMKGGIYDKWNQVIFFNID